LTIFFTDPNLLVQLRGMGFQATETIRDNHTRGAPFPSESSTKKAKRGDFSYFLGRKEEIFLVKWRDSSVVNVTSNNEGYLSVGSVKQYSLQEKKTIQVQIPMCITNYNAGMGGVDHHDKLAASYRPAICGKKWWYKVFSHILNVAVTYAWLLHRLVEPKTLTHISLTYCLFCALL
jgi:hypothetical protein